MFSQACVKKNSVHRMGVCMVKGQYVAKGAYMVKGGVCGKGRACVMGGVHGRGHVWRGGACMAGETTTVADVTHHTGMHSCWLLFWDSRRK